MEDTSVSGEMFCHLSETNNFQLLFAGGVVLLELNLHNTSKVRWHTPSDFIFSLQSLAWFW